MIGFLLGTALDIHKAKKKRKFRDQTDVFDWEKHQASLIGQVDTDQYKWAGSEYFKFLVPESMKPSRMGGNDVLCYADLMRRNLTVMAVEFDKATCNELADEKITLDTFGLFMSNRLEEDFNQDDLTSMKAVKINGLPAKWVINYRIDYDTEAYTYYKIAIIEGRNRFYFIKASSSAEKREKNQLAIEKMINSFTEL